MFALHMKPSHGDVTYQNPQVWVNREGEREQWICGWTLYMCIKQTMKSVGIVLRRGGGMKENNGGGESKIYYKHICKCHNVSPCMTIIC
jgi:hypothetical protein